MKYDRYSHLLKKVEKPGRYIGGEYGEFIKPEGTYDTRICFCFPDTYEIGMSNLGMRILTHCLNEVENVFCERCFAPWGDMEQVMRETDTPLYALETGDPLKDFDMVAFTLQYELCYTNVLNMLSLAGIPMRADERGDDMPIILGGGPCTYNPEPMAEFFDIFSIGEGEEALPELARLYRECKSKKMSKAEFLRLASHLEGFYVPSLYNIEYNADGTIKSFEPKYDDVPRTVKKRIITDLDRVSFPTSAVVPYLDTVHDRITLEVFRGCIRGCRFCQAGMVYRPYRQKSPDVLDCNARECFAKTGYSEISLTSLSISDYTDLGELIDKLKSWTDDKKIGLSLPSMRIDAFYDELLKKVSSVRKSGLTFAPEAGTQRMRDVINKNITEQEIMDGCAKAFDGGRNSLKLYFMNGLPGETDEDIAGIAGLAHRILDLYNSKKRVGRAPEITVSVSCFVPKPFTPFQWEPQNSLDELQRKQLLLKDCIKSRRINYKYHEAHVSRLEGVFSRGDRRLGTAIAEAAKRGQRFDSWDEYFDYDNWMSIFADCGIDPDFYANRRRDENEILPWDFLDIGVTKRFLLREKHLSEAGMTTPDCRTKCSGCGAFECEVHCKK